MNNMIQKVRNLLLALAVATVLITAGTITITKDGSSVHLSATHVSSESGRAQHRELAMIGANDPPPDTDPKG